MTTVEGWSTGLNVEELRSCSRIKCDLPTVISLPWGESWDCKIINMSQRGFGIITNAKLRTGDTVHIQEPRAKAKVVWFKDNMMGLKVTN